MSEQTKKELVEDLENMFKDTSSKSFNAGAEAVVEILKQAMKVTGLKYVPALWLDTAAKKIKKWKK